MERRLLGAFFSFFSYHNIWVWGRFSIQVAVIEQGLYPRIASKNTPGFHIALSKMYSNCSSPVPCSPFPSVVAMLSSLHCNKPYIIYLYRTSVPGIRSSGASSLHGRATGALHYRCHHITHGFPWHRCIEFASSLCAGFLLVCYLS